MPESVEVLGNVSSGNATYDALPASNGTSSDVGLPPFVFDDCDMQTIFIYVPCFFVILAAPVHFYYLNCDTTRKSISHSCLNVIKTVSRKSLHSNFYVTFNLLVGHLQVFGKHLTF